MAAAAVLSPLEHSRADVPGISEEDQQPSYDSIGQEVARLGEKIQTLLAEVASRLEKDKRQLALKPSQAVHFPLAPAAAKQPPPEPLAPATWVPEMSNDSPEAMQMPQTHLGGMAAGDASFAEEAVAPRKPPHLRDDFDRFGQQGGPPGNLLASAVPGRPVPIGHGRKVKGSIAEDVEERLVAQLDQERSGEELLAEESLHRTHAPQSQEEAQSYEPWEAWADGEDDALPHQDARIIRPNHNDKHADFAEGEAIGSSYEPWEAWADEELGGECLELDATEQYVQSTPDHGQQSQPIGQKVGGNREESAAARLLRRHELKRGDALPVTGHEPPHEPPAWSPTTWATVAQTAKEAPPPPPPPPGGPRSQGSQGASPAAASPAASPVGMPNQTPNSTRQMGLHVPPGPPPGSAAPVRRNRAAPMTFEEVRRFLEGGIWEGSRSETYECRPKEGRADEWICVRNDEYGERVFPLRWHQEHGCIYWGQTYFMDPTDFEYQPNAASWYRHGDLKKSRPQFLWRRFDKPGSSAAKSSKKP